MVDSTYVKYRFQWYRAPELQAVVSAVRFYKPVDTHLHLPMISHEIFVALCPSINRDEFDCIASRFYSRRELDLAARAACNFTASNYELVCIFQDKQASDHEFASGLSISDWDGLDIGKISAADIGALKETLDIPENWHPKVKVHETWSQLASEHYC